MVAKAIHVLVTSYSHLIKTDSYLKGIKSDKTTGVQHVGSPMPGADVSSIGADALGKSIIHESATRVDSESHYKSSTVSSLDSEGEAKSANLKSYSPETQLGGKLNRQNFLSTEAHGARFMRSSLHFGQEESQLTSPAISPDEMYSFVFAPVDEEMVGDPSYLVTIIVEFLHRYAISLSLKVVLALNAISS